jgi:hypothetical protein
MATSIICTFVGNNRLQQMKEIIFLLPAQGLGAASLIHFFRNFESDITPKF